MNQALRIAIDARALGAHRTGDEVYTREIIKHLIQEYPENEYHLLGADPIHDIHSSANVIHHTITPDNKLWTYWTMPKYVRSIEPDILHVQYTTPLRFPYIPKQCKIVTTVHDIAFKTNPKWISFKDRVLWQATLKQSLKRADAVIAVSSCTKNDILRFYHLNPNNVHVIYNGVEERYQPIHSQEVLDKIALKYKLPEKIILYLGTLQPRKNIPMLMKAFSALQNKHHHTLVIAGKRDGYNYDPLIEPTRKELHSNDIQFIGYVDEEDKPALYSYAQIFAWPSLYEGFGLPPIEAAACGTQVLAVDTSCHRELLNDYALIVDPTPNAITDGLKKAMEHPVKHPRPLYSWKAAARETMKLYRTLGDKRA